jgi:uncharacterized protein involved in cysteine biosynthesis
VRDVISFVELVISVGRAVRPVCWFTHTLYLLIDITVFMSDTVRIPWKVRKNFFRKCFLTTGSQVEIC